MKKWGITAIVLLIGAVSGLWAEETHPQQIVAYGTSTIQAVPNQMKWLLNVRNLNPSSSGAAEIHSETVAKVLGFLRQNKIGEETIQTSRMQLGENEKWNPALQQNVTEGYVAFTDIQFTLPDFSKYSPIWMGLSAIHGVRVRSVTLDTSERIRLQNEARTQAVIAARDKARAIAETLGMSLGRALSVEEDLSASEVFQPQMTNVVSNDVRWTGSAGGAEQVAPGSIPIRARVKAAFRLPER